MNRLHKKCFIASTGMHLLLVLILFVGPAFLSSDDRPVPAQYIDIIPSKIIESAFVGGGNPKAKPPPPAMPRQDPTPAPVDPAPSKQPKAQKSEPVEEPKAAESLTPSDKKRKPQIEVKIVERNSQTKSKPTQPSEAQLQARLQAKARAERAAQFQNVLENLKDGLSSSTSIDIPGPGGEAYAGYDIVLQSIYKKHYDQALAIAGDLAASGAEVGVSVTVERNGNVVASRVINPSGNAPLDRLVRRVLEDVKFIRPFPEGAKDAQRTFNILFELKPKRAIG
jgi:TonB family protein